MCAYTLSQSSRRSKPCPRTTSSTIRSLLLRHRCAFTFSLPCERVVLTVFVPSYVVDIARDENTTASARWGAPNLCRRARADICGLEQVATRMGPPQEGLHVVCSRELSRCCVWCGMSTNARRSDRFWLLATDSLPPQDAKDLEEDLGIEKDTPEHSVLEQGPLCRQAQANSLKRKRP